MLKMRQHIFVFIVCQEELENRQFNHNPTLNGNETFLLLQSNIYSNKLQIQKHYFHLFLL